MYDPATQRVHGERTRAFGGDLDPSAAGPVRHWGTWIARADRHRRGTGAAGR
ncbi:hypothetical protein [Cryobacterium sp. TMT3-29-2]|uniref:hypothetical protein n=1 Tax=Cryobacterium sp. TMT3-29-2 TaxID=2555867 RepID=UPI001F53EF46|nr:hypothetical protein [Cryobacterium sp. TMT3-29-2]